MNLGVIKRHILWVFLDIGNPMSQTWEGRLIYKTSKWLVKRIDVREYFGEDYA